MSVYVTLYVECLSVKLSSVCPGADSQNLLSVMVHGKWCMASGAWLVVHGKWCMACGAWQVVHGLWCMASGAWLVVHGKWCMASGAWLVVDVKIMSGNIVHNE